MREVWARRVAPRIQSDRGLWLLVFLGCLLVYLATARWTDQANDAMAAAWPAWTLAHHATLHLDTVRGVPDCIWFIHANGHLVSNRMIGVILIGVPVNLLLGWTGLPALAAAALTASLVTAAAMATIAVVVRRVLGSTNLTLAAVGVLAFGTATWTVASKELWTHGPDALWLSLALLALSRRRYLLVGLAFVPAILTRPHLLVAVLVIAAAVAVLDRRLAPLLAVPPAFAGLGLLVTLNHAIFGTWSLSGGYTGYSAAGSAHLTHSGGLTSALAHQVSLIVHPLAGAMFSPWNGVFLYTPVMLIALIAMPVGIRRAPSWAIASALGGIVYLLAQYHVDTGFSGGNFFFSNRLVIEAFVLCLPLLAHGTVTAMERMPRLRPAVVGLATLSVSIHATGALLAPWLIGIRNDPWTDWYLGIVVRAAGVDGVVVAAVGVLATVTAVLVAAGVVKVSSAGSPESSPHPVDVPRALVHSA